jgi:glycosyltransferase involved in cell wall biosynthesis
MIASQRPISVLWLQDHIGYDGMLHGGGSHALKVIPRFDASRWKVVFCVLRNQDCVTKLFEKEGIKVIHFGRRKIDPRTLVDVLQVMKKDKIQIIHAHGYGSSNFGRIAGAVCGIPTLLHAHDEEPTYPWYQNLADYVLSSWNGDWIAISEAVKDACVRKRHCLPHDVKVLHPGIPLEKFKPPTQRQIDEQKHRLDIGAKGPIVGTVARLREEKGVRFLLEAVPYVVQLLPGALFLIVGDGPLRSELENRCRELGVETNVKFLGHCEDVAGVMSVFDLQVVPSVSEGFGLSVIEAMAMKKPIIATKVGGIVEVLRDGENALLVEPENSRTLAEKILLVLKNKDLAMRLAEQAEQDSRQFEIQNYVRSLETHYLNLLASSERAQAR